MTVVEEQVVVVPPQGKAGGTGVASWLRAPVFGTAIGVELGERDLQVVILRARPNGARVVAQTVLPEFRIRPAKEWGSEFHAFLRHQGEKHLSATVVLPRREVIVRQLALPGVKKNDVEAAIGYQIESLHPYGDEEVAYAWSPAGVGSALVGIVRRSVLQSYLHLFQEAGVPCAGFTFSASALYGAVRLYGTANHHFVTWREEEAGTVEVYGESAARGVFSAEFDMAPARALALACAELRLSEEAVRPLDATLPPPRNNVVQPSPLAYAAALAAAGNWRTPLANLLATEERTLHSRMRWVPTIVLVVALLLAGGALFAYQRIRSERYMAEVAGQIARVQPLAARAAQLDKRADDHRSRIALLDNYRKRAQGDIDVLVELSRLLPPTVWAQSVEITQDYVTISGEADQAAPLLKVLDASPLFHNSEFQMGNVRTQTGEQFRIRTQRRLPK